MCSMFRGVVIFFFNDTATTEIYTLSLHDALPIYRPGSRRLRTPSGNRAQPRLAATKPRQTTGALALDQGRSEEHTSELQSRQYLVCRLLLEKKKTNYNTSTT